MAVTLSEKLKELDGGDVRGAVSLIAEHLQKSDDDKLASFTEVLAGIATSQKEFSTTLERVVEVLEKILDRPDPEFPEQKEVEFPSIQKVEMSRPTWYSEPKDFPDLAESFSSLARAILSEGEQTRELLSQLIELESQEEVLEDKLEAKTVNTGAVRPRRTTQWKIATFPQQAGTSAITSAGDGVTYYLPSACIPNSETIRLNGGLPLSHGVDYTLSGNRVVYQQDQSNSQQEIRYQTK